MAMKFKPKLAPTIATAIVFPILMSLGFWQLDRAELKQQQLDIYTARSKQAPVILRSNDKIGTMKIDNYLYSTLAASGQYDSKRNFLFDNRVYKGQVGFYVITPFVIEPVSVNPGSSKQVNLVVLVNRGWIKGNRLRSELPKFDTIKTKISIKGLGYVPSENFFAVDNVKIDPQSYPAVIQSVDFEAIQEALGMNVYPFILRLDPKSESGFVREWPVVTSSPEKSQSYAAQWFTMALVVLIIFLSSCFNFKREKTA